METSKIKEIRLKNFMTIRDAVIPFTENNIISLCGYNDSGKSAVTRFLEVMFYNAYPSEQYKFITDNEDFWEGSLVFTDGVEIKRAKYSDGKSEFEMTLNGKVVFTNRLDNGSLAAMGDVPEKIKEYLGVIKDEYTDEQLNVRRNTDKLFLIETTGGDNYKILNSVLQSDMLSETSKRINEDKNKLNKEINNLGTKKEVLENQIINKSLLPEFVIEDTKSNLDKVVENSNKLVRLGGISTQYNYMNKIEIHDELQEVDLSKLLNLKDVIKGYNLSSVDIQPEVKKVDISRILDLKNIINGYNSLDTSIYEELEPIDVERFKLLLDIGTKTTTYLNANKGLEDLDKKLNNVRKELEELSHKHNLKICGNCGSVV